MNNGKKISIIGAGESGFGAALLATKKGYDVFVSDSGNIPEKFRASLTKEGIRFEENAHSTAEILEADEIIKSPGVPESAEPVKKGRASGIPVISEIEFAARHTDARMICITGTNGKTTTTLLTHHIMEKAGLNTGLAGNVGKSFAWQVAMEDHDYFVLELSSFQLDGMYDFRADIAVLLNITPDHLDRYENNLGKYIDSKFRITNNQTSSDAFIYCADDLNITSDISSRNIKAKHYPFSIATTQNMSGYIENDELIIETYNQQMHMSLFELALQGKHNIYNSLASGIATRLLDIRKEVVRDSLSDFKNIEHRLEYVMSVHGIDFINDSKATNVNSTWYALECMEKPVVWIVGGVDKGNDYEMLKELVESKVKGLVCLGIDNKKILETYNSIPEVREVRTAAEAVSSAYEIAGKGDVVLLSPACASFDLFKNYEDRGRQFKDAVKSL